MSFETGIAKILLATFVLWLGLAAFNMLGQRKLFFEEGREELYDFWMPKMCLAEGYADNGVKASAWYETPEGRRFFTARHDKIYPAFALLPLKLFPATRSGAWCWTIVASLIFLAALFVASGFRLQSLLLAASMPFLFNLERGNPTWLSAAFVAIFLAWWDDEKPWKRYSAALCLAAATVMKISPVLLGFLYLRKDLTRPAPYIAGIAALLFFFLPWPLIPGGFENIPLMIQNAADHHAEFCRSTDFGLIQIWRTIRVALNLSASEAWPGMLIVARVSQLLGLGAAFYGAWHRRYFLLVGGMLLAAGNMYYYGALYLLPCLFLDPHLRLPTSTFFSSLYPLSIILLLTPLQLVFLGHSCNQTLGNLALLTLMTLSLFNYPFLLHRCADTSVEKLRG